MRNDLGIMLLAIASTLACGDSGSTEVDPPPMDAIFIELDWSAEDVNRDGFDPTTEDVNGNGVEDFETRYFFDDALFARLCVVPDADSFDDYENAELNIARGTSPIDVSCEADGIMTGPLEEELYPSKWCKKPSCTPSE